MMQVQFLSLVQLPLLPLVLLLLFQLPLLQLLLLLRRLPRPRAEGAAGCT